MDSEQFLNKILAARTAQGDLQAVGRCISFTDLPTVGIRTRDGQQCNWIASLCEVVTEDPALADALFPQCAVNAQNAAASDNSSLDTLLGVSGRIQSAIIAERERCAKIAEGVAVPPEFCRGSAARDLARGVYGRAGQEIAEKIRQV